MSSMPSRKVRRYHPAQRFVHWLGASGFILLLLTGGVLVWSPLSFLAAGGYSRLLHRIGAILYILWPVLYVALDPAGLRETIKESITFTSDDIAWFKHVISYFFGRTASLPPQGRVNAGQKLHHIGVAIFSVSIAATGAVLWAGAGRLDAVSLSLTAAVHDLSMLALTVLLVGHLYFTFVYGALDGMLKGYVTEEYARMEHPKWLAALPESAFITQTLEGTKPAPPVAEPLAAKMVEQASESEAGNAAGS
jgi:formate dehydrogenase subunit gamma